VRLLACALPPRDRKTVARHIVVEGLVRRLREPRPGRSVRGCVKLREGLVDFAYQFMRKGCSSDTRSSLQYSRVFTMKREKKDWTSCRQI